MDLTSSDRIENCIDIVEPNNHIFLPQPLSGNQSHSEHLQEGVSHLSQYQSWCISQAFRSLRRIDFAYFVSLKSGGGRIAILMTTKPCLSFRPRIHFINLADDSDLS